MIKKWIRNFSRTNRLTDNQIYGLVMREIDEDFYDDAARAKAIVDSKGDFEKFDSFYIEHRVGIIKDQVDEYLDNAQRAPNTKIEQSSQKTEKDIIVAALKNYRVPPREIREKYKSEFEIWFKEWCSIDQNRKFLLHSAWKNFCSEKLDIKLAN